MRDSGRAFLGLALRSRGVKTSNRCPCLLPKWGWAGPLNGVRVGTDVVPAREISGLGGLPPPLGGAMCRDQAQHPAFAPGNSEVAVGFWSFCILLPKICLSCPCMQLFLVSYSVFVFCGLRRHLSRWKHCSKGSHVTACLKTVFGKYCLFCFVLISPVWLHRLYKSWRSACWLN